MLMGMFFFTMASWRQNRGTILRMQKEYEGIRIDDGKNAKTWEFHGISNTIIILVAWGCLERMMEMKRSES